MDHDFFLFFLRGWIKIYYILTRNFFFNFFYFYLYLLKHRAKIIYTFRVPSFFLNFNSIVFSLSLLLSISLSLSFLYSDWFSSPLNISSQLQIAAEIWIEEPLQALFIILKYVLFRRAAPLWIRFFFRLISRAWNSRTPLSTLILIIMRYYFCYIYVWSMKEFIWHVKKYQFLNICVMPTKPG